MQGDWKQRVRRVWRRWGGGVKKNDIRKYRRAERAESTRTKTSERRLRLYN